VSKRFLGAGDGGYGRTRKVAMQLLRGKWLIGKAEAGGRGRVDRASSIHRCAVLDAGWWMGRAPSTLRPEWLLALGRLAGLHRSLITPRPTPGAWPVGWIALHRSTVVPRATAVGGWEERHPPYAPNGFWRLAGGPGFRDPSSRLARLLALGP